MGLNRDITLLKTSSFLAGILVFFILFGTAQAQPPAEKIAQIESMESANEENMANLKLWKQDSDKDLAFQASLKLASFYWQSGDDKNADEMFGYLLSRFDTLGKEQQIQLLLEQSEYEDSRDNFDVAQEILKLRAIPLAEPDSPQLGQVYVKLALYLQRHAKNAEAIRFANKAAEEFKRVGDNLGLSYAYTNLGIIMQDMRRLAEALDYHQQARRLVEKFGLKEDLASSYYNLGDIYEETNDHQNALEYYQKALALDIELNNAGNIAYDHLAIGSIFRRKGQFDSALEHVQQAIDLLQQLEADYSLSESFLRKAAILKAMQDNEARKLALANAEAAALRAGAEAQMRNVHYSFGQYYVDLGEYELAKHRFTQGLKIADKTSNLFSQHAYNYKLADLYKKLGESKTALQHLSTAYAQKLQLVEDAQLQEAEKHKRDINLLEQQLRVEQLELQQAEQTQVIEAQKLNNLRNTLLFVFAIVLLLGMGYLLWQRRRLALLKAKLYQDTLEQKDRVLADVSHELRTPLTSLKLQVDALQRNLVKDVDASYEKISRKVMDINQLITQIHDLAQSDTGSLIMEKSHCNLTECFAKWNKEFKDFVEDKGLTYQSHIGFGSNEAEFDLQRIRQVLFNLLSNSCFYTDKPGTVSVDVSSDSENLTVKIEDSAPGVAEKEHKKIFQRLYRVEKSRSRQTGGSGLGLAICKSLVEAHGGSIHAQESKLGGLCVVLTLPIAG